MKLKYCFIISMIFFLYNPFVYAQYPYRLPLIEPLEITLHKHYIIDLDYEAYQYHFQQKVGSLSLEFFSYTFQRSFYRIHDKYRNFDSHSFFTYNILHYYYTKTTMNQDFMEFELLPFLNQQNLPWNQQNDQFFIRTSLTYGKHLNHNSTFSAILGIMNEQLLKQEQISYNNMIQYSKIFFVPGIQLRSNSVVLKTFLEMPLYSYNFVTDTPKTITPSKNNINANFQIQIQPY